MRGVWVRLLRKPRRRDPPPHIYAPPCTGNACFTVPFLPHLLYIFFLPYYYCFLFYYIYSTHRSTSLLHYTLYIIQYIISYTFTYSISFVCILFCFWIRCASSIPMMCSFQGSNIHVNVFFFVDNYDLQILCIVNLFCFSIFFWLLFSWIMKKTRNHYYISK